MDSHFPYPKKRAYQEEFMKLIDESIKCKRNLALEAATGFGKTVCVLSSLLPLAQELSKKIVYLCRTHKQMDRVIEELSEIHKKVKVSGISLRGRRELCLNSLVLNHTRDASSAQHVCSLLRKMGKCEFHKKTKEEEERVFELELALSQRPTYAREILDICQSEGFCPYDLSKELLGDVELVACSYLYMFHPEIRKNFLESIGCRMEDLILVLDEAHNLPELAINLGSSRLSILSMRGGVREALEYEEEEIARFLEFTQKIVLELSEKYEIEDEVLLNPKELTQRFFSEKLEFLSSKALVLELFEARLLEFLSYMKKRGQEIQKDRLKKEKPPRSFIHTASLFFKNWILLKDREDYCYLLKKYETRGGGESFRLEIVALDPRNITLQVLDYVYASVSMSGTLNPISAYTELVGLKNIQEKAFPSPFKKSNILVVASRGVTTKGNFRSLEMYRKLSRKVSEVVENTPKNSAVFCASYEVLQGLISSGLKLIVEKPMFVEDKSYTSRQNDELVRAYKNASKKDGAVLLGVLGGRNSEGEDYPGDEMNSVVLVGVPYAQPSARIQAQIEYYKRVFPGKGRYYGYYLPAHRRLNQGAGRAHRLLEDRAAIIFLDYRTAKPFVKRDISSWIRREMRVIGDKDDLLGRYLKLFFEIGS